MDRMSMGGRCLLATEQEEEGKRAAPVRVDSEGSRFLPAPISRPVPQPSTHRQREPRPRLPWCAICSVPLVVLSRWIKLVPCSGARQRSRLETSPRRRSIRDRRDQEAPMECHRA